jgi:ubiquinone/menaquinone biosynthesis C-methylase UbiE
VPDIETLVQGHYGRNDLLERIFAALERDGIDPEKFQYTDLQRYDQLHGRGLAATREHVEHAGIEAGMHVLDLGCGVGGCSRYLAAVTGCRVTGVDLTQEFVDAARELTRRCGLGDRIAYRQANALDLPFPDASFDHVWCHNVTMNIPDKPRLAAQVARVLKPGGRFSCSEMAQGPAGEPIYPLPWARGSASSFLVTPAEMSRTLEAAGLRIIKEIDLSEVNIAYSREMQARRERGEPPSRFNEVFMGDDFLVRSGNSSTSVMQGRLVEHLFVAQK